MSVDDALNVGAGARLALRTLGDASLYLAHPEAEPALVFAAGKPLAVITYLALSSEKAVSRERLLDLLWSNLEPSGAAAAVRQAIWQIRRRLSEEAIVTTRDRVTL